jgi:hypothetical protein
MMDDIAAMNSVFTNPAAVLVFFIFSVFASAQGQQATIGWTDGINPPGTTQYIVYRQPGPCGPQTTWVVGYRIAGPMIVQPVNTAQPQVFAFPDKTVTSGTWCYTVSAQFAGTNVEGPLANPPATAIVGAAPPPPSAGVPAAPTNITVTVP